MEKLTGLKKIKTAVFISGTGSNLNSIIKFSKTKKSPVSIDLIISNTSEAKGLRYAYQFVIMNQIFNFKNIKIAEKKNINITKKRKYKIYLPGWFYENFIQRFYKKI